MNSNTTNAFISYSHQDAPMLDLLHKHLAQLERDGIITTWTDQEVLAGGVLDAEISSALVNSKVFIALLSPDYINSKYCYEREFEKAMEMQEQGKIIIVPVILEPCDWLNTPFNKFKAFPKDGKAVSDWENKNNAFLDVIQNLRRLATSPDTESKVVKSANPSQIPMSRNYRVQKDFDSIEKMEFVEKTFQEIKEHLEKYLIEVSQLDNIKARVIADTEDSFECLLVNRNKIDTEATLKVTTAADSDNRSVVRSRGLNGRIRYMISIKNGGGTEIFFSLEFDDYDLFWTQTDYFYEHFGSNRTPEKFTARDISDSMWDEFLKAVGIYQ